MSHGFVETKRGHLVIPNLVDNGFDKQQSKRWVNDKEKEERKNKRNSYESVSIEGIHSMICLPKGSWQQTRLVEKKTTSIHTASQAGHPQIPERTQGSLG